MFDPLPRSHSAGNRLDFFALGRSFVFRGWAPPHLQWQLCLLLDSVGTQRRGGVHVRSCLRVRLLSMHVRNLRAHVARKPEDAWFDWHLDW